MRSFYELPESCGTLTAEIQSVAIQLETENRKLALAFFNFRLSSFDLYHRLEGSLLLRIFLHESNLEILLLVAKSVSRLLTRTPY